jgi:hypothetical protein
VADANIGLDWDWKKKIREKAEETSNKKVHVTKEDNSF